MSLDSFQSPLPSQFYLLLHSSFVNTFPVLYPSTMLSFLIFFMSVLFFCLQATSSLSAPSYSFFLSSPGEGILMLARLSINVTSAKRPSLTSVLENAFLLCVPTVPTLLYLLVELMICLAGLSPPVLLILQGHVSLFTALCLALTQGMDNLTIVRKIKKWIQSLLNDTH